MESNGVLKHKLLNTPLASCFLINLRCLNKSFLLQHIAHFDYIFVLPLLVFETLGFILCIFFLYFKQ